MSNKQLEIRRSPNETGDYFYDSLVSYYRENRKFPWKIVYTGVLADHLGIEYAVSGKEITVDGKIRIDGEERNFSSVFVYNPNIQAVFLLL